MEFDMTGRFFGLLIEVTAEGVGSGSDWVGPGIEIGGERGCDVVLCSVEMVGVVSDRRACGRVL
jgi:hypothetical protein